MVFKVSDPIGEVNSSPRTRSPKGTPRVKAKDRHRLLPADLVAELDKLTISIMKLPEVDPNRVETVRQAIVEGTYRPDIMHTVDKLICFESVLPDDKSTWRAI